MYCVRRWISSVRCTLLLTAAGNMNLLGRALEAAEQIASLAPWGVRLTKRGMWAALEIPSEQAAVEFARQGGEHPAAGRTDRVAE